MYGTRSAWLSHEAQIHWRIFRCVDHPENRVSCPFCLSEGPFLRGLPNHTAYHLERLACFAATRQSLDHETGLSSDTQSDNAQGDNDPDALELESEASSEQSSISKDSEDPRKSQVQTTLPLGKVIRQALVQSSCPDEDSDPEPAISFPAPKYLPIDELNRIINYKSFSDELERQELFKEPELSRRALEVQGDAGFNIQEGLDPDQTDSRSNTIKYSTRKKIFASLVLMGKFAAITQVLDEGLSDADLPFNLDPDSVKLVKRDKTFAEPIAAFKNWMEYEASMFYTYQWYMVAPYFVLTDDDEPRVTHRAMSYMIPLPFSVTETVPDSVMSSMCGCLGMQKITIHHAYHIQRDPKFWASNPSGNDAVDMARRISSQPFGLADALQLIRELFPSGVLAENGHRLQPPHRDLSPERILCFETKGIIECVLKIGDFGSMQYHEDQAHHQRGSETFIDSTYRPTELLTGEMAPNSDLWSFGCIILHFIVWYHGGWAMVNSLSASSCAEEEGFGTYTHDDKFFKHGNLNITRSSLDPQRLTEGRPNGTVTGQGKDVPNTIVLKESIKLEISKFLDKGNSQFIRDIMGVVKRDLQTDAGDRASCKAVRDYLKELHKKCTESDAYCRRTLSS
ncbi:hypothetical protein DER46DRAFT_573804 [Fusarium sp. MPI-SDFR-AT-0072]|nr:hypothetical protein DER46DRAFT_573804 [Fusarium sp. MPI-SDFR-AT-0072]